MTSQTYEKYWSLTNAFTDYNGGSFLNTLRICVDFIDEFKGEPYSNAKYDRLQRRIGDVLGITLISVRKAINQLVKLGFINSFLVDYPLDSLEYLAAKSNRKRSTLLSKIVYSNSSFNRSVNNYSSLHQLNFLIRTLIEIGKLSKAEILALMIVDIGNVERGYLKAEELQVYVNEAIEQGFIERKYNQVGYLYNLLGKLDDLVFVSNDLYFTEDAQQIFGDELKEERRQRDPYLHRLYKNQLQDESIAALAGTKCMIEKLAYPVLIASHIKPFIKSSEHEAYDADNGILLSRNIDSLFDLGYITFSDEGAIVISDKLDIEVASSIAHHALDKVFINEKRIHYLNYHRREVYNKKFKHPA